MRKYDVAKGMVRSTAVSAVADDPSAAPPFAVAFYLEDPMSIPVLAQEAIWALNNVECCVLKGEEGAIMDGIEGFRCDLKNNVIQEQESGKACKLMQMQLRIMEASAASQVMKRYYVMLVVQMPLPFSLRKAIQISTRSVDRKAMVDINFTDERRGVWRRLAIHASQYIHVPGYIKDPMATYDDDLNWMHSSGGDGFSVLFTVRGAMDWIKMHFIQQQHADDDTVEAMRIGEMEVTADRSSNLMDMAHIANCRAYHIAVDKATAWTAARKGWNKRRRGDHGGEQRQDDSEDRRTIELLEYGNELRWIPACKIALNVRVPKPVEGPLTLDAFKVRIKTFPLYVSLQLFSSSAGHTHLLDEILGDEHEELDQTGVDRIVLDTDAGSMRTTIANGDAAWAWQMKRIVEQTDPCEGRYEAYLRLLRLGISIACTRANGSDNYTNSRVAAYNRYAEIAKGRLSREDVQEVYDLARRGEKRLGCPVEEAMHLVMEVLCDCNEEWGMWPDNFHLVFQVLVSDIMLCLNFHDSAIEAAPNGIGATLIIRDGGGSYRIKRSSTDPPSQVNRKRNGTGADKVINAYKNAVQMSNHTRDSQCSCPEFFTDLKKATELSIVQDTCNTYVSSGSKMVLSKTVSEMMFRMYTTELKAGSDPASMGFMHAISWLMTRNTTSADSSTYKTTYENVVTKKRDKMEYRQMLYGYLAFCGNRIDPACEERFATIAAVARNIASGTMGLDSDAQLSEAFLADVEEEDETASTEKKRVDLERLYRMARPLFFTCLHTAINAGFIQWTGMLGPLRESPVPDAILSLFYHHLGKCESLLNPSMVDISAKPRALEVSRARGVAVSLLAYSVRETIEAGRRDSDNHREAVERVCSALKSEGTPHAAVSWIMADTLEHMLRLDFMVIMQILCQKFGVPDDVLLDDVLSWLSEPDNNNHNNKHAEFDAFYEAHRARRGPNQDAELMLGGGDLTPVANCMYLTDECFKVSGLSVFGTPEEQIDFFCSQVGRRLYNEFGHTLSNRCQIENKREGISMVCSMLECNLNRNFEWPSLLTGVDGLKRFWKGSPPAMGKESLSLAPLRMVKIDANLAKLYVDYRWLLLFSALAGSKAAQSCRFAVVTNLVQRFYQKCVPLHMMTSPTLFNGLPFPVMGYGFSQASVLPNALRLLKRPKNENGRTIGMNAPIVPTGMVEDMGAAAPRLMLAHSLGMKTDSFLPTECVHYSFPHGVWTPVCLEADVQLDAEEHMAAKGTFGALKTENDGCFWLECPSSQGKAFIKDVSSAEDDGALSGRVSVPLRPLCFYNRPGMLVKIVEDVGEENPVESFAVLVRYVGGRGAYEALRADGGTLFLTPAVVDQCIVRPDAPLLVDADGLKACHPNLEFSFEAEGRPVLCLLDSQGAPDDLPPEKVQVRFRRIRRAAQSSMTLRFGSTTRPRGASVEYASMWITSKCVLNKRDLSHVCESIDFFCVRQQPQ